MRIESATSFYSLILQRRPHSLLSAFLPYVILVWYSSITALTTATANPVNWQVDCLEIDSESQKKCQLSQILTAKGTGQHVMTVIVRPGTDNESGLSMLLALPHGLHLPTGIAIQVDGGKSRTAPIQTSDAKGVYSVFPLPEPLFQSMKKGKNLEVSMKSAKGEIIKLSVSLIGLTAASKKIQ